MRTIPKSCSSDLHVVYVTYDIRVSHIYVACDVEGVSGRDNVWIVAGRRGYKRQEEELGMLEF